MYTNVAIKWAQMFNPSFLTPHQLPNLTMQTAKVLVSLCRLARSRAGRMSGNNNQNLKLAQFFFLKLTPNLTQKCVLLISLFLLNSLH